MPFIITTGCSQVGSKRTLEKYFALWCKENVRKLCCFFPLSKLRGTVWDVVVSGDFQLSGGTMAQISMTCGGCHNLSQLFESRILHGVGIGSLRMWLWGLWQILFKGSTDPVFALAQDSSILQNGNIKNWMGINPVLKLSEGNCKRTDQFLKALIPPKLLINLLKRVNKRCNQTQICWFGKECIQDEKPRAVSCQHREHFSCHSSRHLSLPSEQEQCDFWPNF